MEKYVNEGGFVVYINPFDSKKKGYAMDLIKEFIRAELGIEVNPYISGHGNISGKGEISYSPVPKENYRSPKYKNEKVYEAILIHNNDKKTTFQDIAKELGVTKLTVSRCVKHLRKKGVDVKLRRSDFNKTGAKKKGYQTKRATLLDQLINKYMK